MSSDHRHDHSEHYSAEDISQMSGAMTLSLVVGFLMLGVKAVAYAITGSTAILSDVGETLVHALAVTFAAYSLRLSLKPADAKHPYGHDRINFFSAGFEGAMIVLAAIGIVIEAVREWITGLSIRNLDAGVLFVAAATVINGGLGWYLIRQGKKHGSLVLEANGKHVLTDSWTSLGVVVGLVMVRLTGWLPFDPIVAIVVGGNILWTGYGLMRRSVGGLMDESDPETDTSLRTILERETARFQIEYHGLRHRNAGSKLLVEFHLLFPHDVTVAFAHERTTVIERAIRDAFPGRTEIISHVEPLGGPCEARDRVVQNGTA